MFLTILDLILILALFLFIAFGFALGLVETIGALIGVVVGVWGAGALYEPFGSWLEPYLLGHGNIARIIAFILIFTIINRTIGLIFWIINKVFNLVSIIPFTKSLNRILGALLGLIEGVLVLGVIIYFVSRFVTSEWFISVLASSKVAVLLVDIASVLTPLLPALLRQLQSVF
jgi:membrane protein required for colicin V production